MAPPGARPADSSGAPRGHRLLAHTADCALEAWGPTRVACLEEAVLALVESFADTSGAPAPTPVPVTIEPAADPDLLVLLLEEVIYTADVLGVVPVTVELADTDDGGVAGSFETTQIDSIEIIGPAPKGVSRQATCEQEGGSWRCQALIDV